MTDNSISLLPNGLKDLLPPEAEKEAHIINILMSEFAQFGYARVKPPMVEFEESLLSDGPGATLACNTFRLMDPVSQRMMGLRADTTAQIARIANSRLADEPRPLRLSYAADVLKVNGSQLRPERQFCQVGCEMIGGEDTSDDVEVCLTAINALHKIGVKNLSIDLTIPALVDDLFSAYNIDANMQQSYSELLKKRDRDGISEIKSEATPTLLMLLDASGVAKDAIEQIDKIETPKSAHKNIVKLKEAYDALTEVMKVYGLDDINITIDLIERRGFDYQKGISFTLFAKNVRGELGRGGRYTMSAARDETACGFTLYMDSVLYASDVALKSKSKEVPKNTSWEEIKKLQEDGYKISRKN